VLSETTKIPICGEVLSARALSRTRTVDPLLTMEDSRCGRGTQQQRLFTPFPCYCRSLFASRTPPSNDPDSP
jgi:hypothetical protein